MKKYLILTAVLGLAVTLNVSAQDDDMYFTPKKKTAEEKAHYVGNTYYSGSSRSSDDYNRRNFQRVVCPVDTNDVITFEPGDGQYPDSVLAVYNDSMAVSQVYYNDEDDDYRITRNMGRFYGFASPRFGYMSPWGFYNDPFWYDQAYYWGLYDPYYAYTWGYPYYGHYGYLGWYDPWYSWGYWGYPYHGYWGHGYWGHGGGHIHGGSIAHHSTFRNPIVTTSGSNVSRRGGSGFNSVSRAVASQDRRSVSATRSNSGSTVSGVRRSYTPTYNTTTTTTPTYTPSRSSSSYSGSSYSGGGGSFSGGGSRGGGVSSGGSRGGGGGRR